MPVIWKYELEVTDDQIVSIPQNSQPMSVDVQNGQVCMWVYVEDPEQHEKRDLHIKIFGTGNHFEKPGPVHDMRFIGTFQQLNGRFIGHVFQMVPRISPHPIYSLPAHSPLEGEILDIDGTNLIKKGGL